MLWSKITIGLLALVLLGSLAGNYALYNMTQGYYLNLNAVRLDPLGLSRYETGSVAKPDDSQPRVVFFGDSRAQMWTAPEVDGFEFINRGIGGQTTAQIRGRFAEHVAPLEPDIVVLQMGANDLKTMPLFPTLAEDILAECKANIRWMVEQSTGLGAKVILTTMISRAPIPLARRSVWTSQADDAILDVNEFIVELANDPQFRDSVTLMDAERLLSGDDHVTDAEFRIDMLHVNEEAYAVLNKELVRVLRGE